MRVRSGVMRLPMWLLAPTRWGTSSSAMRTRFRTSASERLKRMAFGPGSRPGPG